jgi:hypothetical protein
MRAHHCYIARYSERKIYLIREEKTHFRNNEVTWFQNYALWEDGLCEVDTPMLRKVNVP